MVEGKFLSGFCFKRQLEGRQEDLVVDWILGDDRAHRGSMKWISVIVINKHAFLFN